MPRKKKEIGFKFEITGQRYEVVRTRERLNSNGEMRTDQLVRARCADCGVFFKAQPLSPANHGTAG